MRVLFAFAVLAVRATSQVDGFRDVLSYLYRCRSSDFDECLERELARTIEEFAEKNETYRLNRYLTVTTTSPGDHRYRHDDHHDGGDLSTKLLNAFNVLQVHYDPEDVDRSTDVFEGRKKKKDKKNKMSMMMAMASMGMTVISGMATKMMMGGVGMIAIKALIIAKLAFLLAAVIALKKLLGGGGGGQQAASWSGGGGGASEHGGYHRSFDPEETKSSALAYREQLQSYEK